MNLAFRVKGFDREQVLALIPDLTVGEVAVVVVGYVVLKTHLQYRSVHHRCSRYLVELVPQAFLCVLFTIYMLLGYDETREKSQIQRSVDQGVRKYIVIKVCANFEVSEYYLLVLSIMQVLVSFITGVLVTIILLSFNVDMALLYEMEEMEFSSLFTSSLPDLDC